MKESMDLMHCRQTQHLIYMYCSQFLDLVSRIFLPQTLSPFFHNFHEPIDDDHPTNFS